MRTEELIGLLGASGTGVCLCPTTEADLADGIGPGAALARAGSPLSVGSDGQTVIDPFAEVQAVEAHQRLATRTRGHFADPVAIATGGHRALSWSDAGSLEPGARADLVALRPGLRAAGVPWESVPAVATADDVREVVVDGRRIVRDGAHQNLDATRELQEVVATVLGRDR